MTPSFLDSKTLGSGDRFSLKLTGKRFDAGVQVFVSAEEAAWPEVELRGGKKILLRGGPVLSDQFPPGVPVAVRVINPDGWQVSMTFTR